MNRVSIWNTRCSNKPATRKTKEWKIAMLNQLKRLQEELNETVDAVEEGDELEVLDGLVDLQVVLDGAVFLSGLKAEEAFDAVMDNNDLKYTQSYDEAFDAVQHYGSDKFNIQEYVDEEGVSYYSVHRNSDNKICKLLEHPKVDLSEFLEVRDDAQ